MPTSSLISKPNFDVVFDLMTKVLKKYVFNSTKYQQAGHRMSRSRKIQFLEVLLAIPFCSHENGRPGPDYSGGIWILRSMVYKYTIERRIKFSTKIKKELCASSSGSNFPGVGHVFATPCTLKLCLWRWKIANLLRVALKNGLNFALPKFCGGIR
jgi:hypothetical protein